MKRIIKFTAASTMMRELLGAGYKIERGAANASSQLSGSVMKIRRGAPLSDFWHESGHALDMHGSQEGLARATAYADSQAAMKATGSSPDLGYRQATRDLERRANRTAEQAMTDRGAMPSYVQKYRDEVAPHLNDYRKSNPISRPQADSPIPDSLPQQPIQPIKRNFGGVAAVGGVAAIGTGVLAANRKPKDDFTMSSRLRTIHFISCTTDSVPRVDLSRRIVKRPAKKTVQFGVGTLIRRHPKTSVAIGALAGIGAGAVGAKASQELHRHSWNEHQPDRNARSPEEIAAHFKKLNSTAYLSGSSALGIGVPGSSDVDVHIPTRSVKSFKRIEKHLKKTLEPSAYYKPGYDHAGFTSKMDGRPIDVSVTYGEKGFKKRAAIRRVASELTDEQRQQIIATKQKLKKAWIAPEARYHAYKRGLDLKHGIPLWRAEPLPQEMRAKGKIIQFGLLKRAAILGTAGAGTGAAGTLLRSPGRPIDEDEDVTGKLLWRRSKVPLIRHYGLGVGTDQVAHVQARKVGGSALFKTESLDAFKAGRPTFVQASRRDAKSRLHEIKKGIREHNVNAEGFSFLKNNCEIAANGVLKLRRPTNQAKDAEVGAVAGGGIGVATALVAPKISRLIRKLSSRQKIIQFDDDLQPHQKRVIKRLRDPNTTGLVVAHGLGSGKTRTAIEAHKALGGDADVIVPAALKGNYAKEMEKWGGNPELTHIQSQQGVATSDEPLRSKFLIVDEGHRARNPGTKISKAIKQSSAKKRLILSGTPIYNNPSDIATLVNQAAGKDVLKEGKAFQNRYTNPSILSRWRGKRISNEGELAKHLQKYVDYHPGDPSMLPKVTAKTVPVPMGKRQSELYRASMGRIPKGMKLDRENIERLKPYLTGPRQVSNTARALDKSSDEEPKIDAAFKDLQTHLANPKGKALIYSNWLEHGVRPIEKRLIAAKIPHGVFTGEEGMKARNQTVKDYNEGKHRALVISSSGAEGLDLKGTRMVQVLEPHFNNAKIRQVVGRSARMGSHSHLPEEDRNVEVRQYVGRPKNRFLPGHSKGVEDLLNDTAREKDEVAKQIMGLLSSKIKPIQFARGDRIREGLSGTYYGDTPEGKAEVDAMFKKRGKPVAGKAGIAGDATKYKSLVPIAEPSGKTMAEDAAAQMAQHKRKVVNIARTGSRIARSAINQHVGPIAPEVPMADRMTIRRQGRKAIRGELPKIITKVRGNMEDRIPREVHEGMTQERKGKKLPGLMSQAAAHSAKRAGEYHSSLHTRIKTTLMASAEYQAGGKYNRAGSATGAEMAEFAHQQATAHLENANFKGASVNRRNPFGGNALRPPGDAAKDISLRYGGISGALGIKPEEVEAMHQKYRAHANPNPQRLVKQILKRPGNPAFADTPVPRRSNYGSSPPKTLKKIGIAAGLIGAGMLTKKILTRKEPQEMSRKGRVIRFSWRATPLANRLLLKKAAAEKNTKALLESRALGSGFKTPSNTDTIAWRHDAKVTRKLHIESRQRPDFQRTEHGPVFLPGGPEGVEHPDVTHARMARIQESANRVILNRNLSQEALKAEAQQKTALPALILNAPKMKDFTTRETANRFAESKVRKATAQMRAERQSERTAKVNAMNEQQAAHASGMKAEQRKGRRNLLIGIGAGMGAGGYAGHRITKPEPEMQFRRKGDILRFDVSPIQKLRNQIRPDKEPSALHDIATGGLEGSVGSLAFLPVEHRIMKGTWKNPLLDEAGKFSKGALGKRLAIGGAIGAVATGLVGAGVSAISRKRKESEPVFSSRRKLIEMGALSIGTAKKVLRDLRSMSGAPMIRPKYKTEAFTGEYMPRALTKKNQTIRGMFGDLKSGGVAVSRLSQSGKAMKVQRIYPDDASHMIDRKKRWNASADPVAIAAHEYGHAADDVINPMIPKSDWSRGGVRSREKAANRIALDLIKKHGSRSEAVGYARVARNGMREQGFSSAERTLHFEDIPRLPASRAVTKDRYIKKIHENDMDRAESGYLRTGLSGAAIGSMLSKGARGRGALIGAGVGAAAQLAARLYTGKTKDQFGDRTYAGKRIDRAPSQIAGLAAVGLAGKAIHNKLGAAKIAMNKWGQRAKVGALTAAGLYVGSKLFARKGTIIQFDEEPQQIPKGYKLIKEMKKTQPRHWSRKWLTDDVNITRRAADLRQAVGRTKGVASDLGGALKGEKALDARGRPRKREWDKPWAQGLKWAALVGATSLGVKGVKHGFDHGLGDLGKIGEFARQGGLKQYAKNVAKKVPGAEKVASKVGEAVQNIKEEGKGVAESVAAKVNRHLRSVAGEAKPPPHYELPVKTKAGHTVMAKFGPETPEYKAEHIKRMSPDNKAAAETEADKVKRYNSQKGPGGANQAYASRQKLIQFQISPEEYRQKIDDYRASTGKEFRPYHLNSRTVEHAALHPYVVQRKPRDPNKDSNAQRAWRSRWKIGGALVLGTAIGAGFKRKGAASIPAAIGEVIHHSAKDPLLLLSAKLDSLLN